MVQKMIGMPTPANRGSPPKKTAADFKAASGSQPVDPYQRSAAKTGTSFDMADLLSGGTATKVPKKLLPSTDAKMAILAQTEQTMPGDVIPEPTVKVQGFDGRAPIIERMAKVIRSRNLDLLNLMDDFLKRPRGSRMPVRNRAFLDVSTFRRALCYAFGNQWLSLAMTTEEFEEIWKKYEKKDAHGMAASPQAMGSGYQGGGGYGQGQGQAESLILWQAFAQDVQRFTDGDHRSEAEKLLLEAELELIAKSEAAEAAALAAHDADDNMGDAKARMAARRAEKEAAGKKPLGKRGCTVAQVAHAKKVIEQTLTGAGGKYDTVREALRDIDNSGDGVLSRDEVKLLLQEHYIMKYKDFYTGQIRGQLDEAVIDTLMDLCDKDGNGIVNADEFSAEVLAGSNTYFFADMADGFESTFDVQGM
jgi:hypothetical protein